MEEAGVKSFSIDDLTLKYDMDCYVLIGLPTELFGQVMLDKAGATNIVDPTIIELIKRDDLITDNERQWFIGNLPEAAKISIHGMSGGPLFAINFDDTLSVWIAGVQSHWCPTNRIAFVCPVKTILEQLPEHLRPV